MDWSLSLYKLPTHVHLQTSQVLRMLLRYGISSQTCALRNAQTTTLLCQCRFITQSEPLLYNNYFTAAF